LFRRPSLVNVYFGKPGAFEGLQDFLDGVDFFNRQKTEQAIEKFNEAIKKNGGSPYPDALVYRGRAEQSLGRKADAVVSFQQALAVRKSDFETETFLEARFAEPRSAKSSLPSQRNSPPSNWTIRTSCWATCCSEGLHRSGTNALRRSGSTQNRPSA
jgi:tetratricopeptide (TPR) repeat protein